MAHRFRVQIPNSPDVEFDTYEDAIVALSRVGVDHSTLAEVDENGSVLSTLSSEELKQIVSEFKSLPSLSVYYGRAKGRLVSDE